MFVYLYYTYTCIHNYIFLSVMYYCKWKIGLKVLESMIDEGKGGKASRKEERMERDGWMKRGRRVGKEGDGKLEEADKSFTWGHVSYITKPIHLHGSM